MASDVSSSQGSSRSLPDDYEKRKQELKAEHEKRLQAIKDDYRDNEAEVQTKLRQTGEAVVNHIRKSSSQELAQTKTESQTQLQTENKAHNRKLASLQDEDRKAYEQTRGANADEIAKLKEKSSTDLKNEIAQYNRDSSIARTKYHDDAFRQQHDGEARLTTYQRDEQDKMKKMQDRNNRTEHQIMMEGSTEINRVQGEEAKKLDATQQLHKTELKTEDEQFHKTINQDKAVHEAALTDQQKKYEERKKIEGMTQEENLVKQRKNLTQNFDKATQANKESLNTQKASYFKELYKQKVDFDKSNSQIENRKDDPFYRSQDFGATLTENSDSYTFKAKAPEHDPDSLEVRIKDDKVILNSARRYEDKTKVSKDETVSTNNYQTQRQEYKLAHPVDRERVLRERTPDGYITLTIPKKGFQTKA